MMNDVLVPCEEGIVLDGYLETYKKDNCSYNLFFIILLLLNINKINRSSCSTFNTF